MNNPFRYEKKNEIRSLKEAIDACINENDNRAKEYIYKRYYGYLIAVILRYVKDSYDAEELVNESFMRVFKGMVSFNAKGDPIQLEKPFLAWMARIATNLSIDHLRAKKQLTFIENNTEFEIVMQAVKPPVDLEVADIMRLLDQLPEIQRIIFNLFEVDGFTHEEIAGKLSIPESTSRTYLTRAKKKLRALYLKSNLE